MKAMFKVSIFSGIAICVIAAGLFVNGCASAHFTNARTDVFVPDGYEFGSGNPPGYYSQSVRSISAPEDTDEVWVIPRNSTAMQVNGESSSLRAQLGGSEMPMPLRHTDVKASVSGYIGAVEVTQQFENPYTNKIEAVYIFPLPHNAAINEFIMMIGKRRIRGIIRERKEAEAIYQEAKRQGYAATLLAEERPNIFRQSVANIEPGADIDVHIKYFQTLDYVDGWYEFVFPMTIGPRFNPPGTTNSVGTIAYLKPGERNGNDISLHVEVDAGVTIEDFECKTHAITKSVLSPEHLVVQLALTETVPNKDFVLRYRVAGNRIRSSLLTQRDERGGYFTLMLYPPEEVGSLSRQPLELVFVLDCSGSMSGGPIEQAKAAIERGLRLLQPGDTFQLINFSASASQLGPQALEATPENVQRGLNYLRSLNADNGTMMLEGVRAALDFPHDPKRMRFVCFLTDGFIGNETEILREVHTRLGDSRIFSFGIGPSVNRYLLDHLAKAGRGAVAYPGPNDDAAKIMDDFFQRVSHPALTNIKMDWSAMQVSEVFPREIPDLFIGRALVLTGKFNGASNAAIRVTGNVGPRPLEFEVPASDSRVAAIKGLPSIWARIKIADLLDQSSYAANPELPYEIKQVALDYGLMSPFTSAIAVDASAVTDGTESETVPVTIPSPAGMKTGASPNN
jgi:Ca-activated chloride channel family protein